MVFQEHNNEPYTEVNIKKQLNDLKRTKGIKKLEIKAHG